MKTYTPIAAMKWMLIVVLSTNVAAHAVMLYSDNFETPLPGPLPSNAATNWIDTSKDADPVPTVGSIPWIVSENAQYTVQVGKFTQALTGYPANGNAGPVWGPSATGGLQYLEMYNGPGNTDQAWAPLTIADQSVIQGNGTLHLSVEIYGLSPYDGWHSNLRIAGFDSPALVGTNAAFNIFIHEGVGGGNGPVEYVGPGGTTTNATGLTHIPATWQTLEIDADFNTDTFTVTLDGVTAPGTFSFQTAGLSTIQSVVLEVNSVTFQNTLFHRGGFDNFELSSSIPEPSTVLLLMIGGCFMYRRLRKNV